MKLEVSFAVIPILVLLSGSTGLLKAGSGAAMKEFNKTTTYQWTTGKPVLSPRPEKGRKVVSAKDPSAVYYRGRWHVFYTTCDEKGSWSMQFVSFKDWRNARSAKAYPKDDNPNLRGYHCAPQVFYFTPRKKWYMIFQSGQPQYSVNDDIDDPAGWSRPKDFFSGAPPGVFNGEWLDFWVICDKTNAFLFFTGDNGRFYRSSTRIGNFPDGMGDPRVVFSDPDKGKVFEGSCTYKIKGQDKYLTIIEAFGPYQGGRYYRSFIADSLDGEWTEQAGTWENPFAGLRNVSFDRGIRPWTKDISHGELIRDGYDETMTIDPDHLEMLFQGRDPASDGMPYQLLPYRIGILKGLR